MMLLSFGARFCLHGVIGEVGMETAWGLVAKSPWSEMAEFLSFQLQQVGIAQSTSAVAC